MKNEPEAIAVVTARAGSKRIPNKNIRDFNGKPLIAWAIENLINSKIFSQVVVSTDSETIAAVAKAAGATVPFLRPTHLSDDFSTTAQVAQHAIDELERLGTATDALYCITYPAAISITREDLIGSRKLMLEGNYDLTFVGTKFATPPEKAWRLTEQGDAIPFQPEHQTARTQDLTAAFHDAGQFYWSRKESWRRIIEGKSVRRALWEMPRSRAIDIDDEDDWKIAEALFLCQ